MNQKSNPAPFIVASTGRTERLLNVDLIRIIAILMVVVLHTVLDFTQRPDFFPTKVWFILEPIVAFSKPGVLLFFMLSGYLVISKNRSVQDNWEKTKNRLLIPLLFFTLLYIAYDALNFNFKKYTIFNFFQKELTHQTQFPSSSLWFLIVLFSIYLLNPLWQLAFAKQENKPIAIYITKLSMVFSLAIALIRFPSMLNQVFFNNFTAWIGFVFFYFYGGLVRNKWIIFDQRTMNVSFIVLGLLGIIFGDFYTMHANTYRIPFIYNGYFFDYLSVPIVILAIGLFNILIDEKTNKKIKQVLGTTFIKPFHKIADLSFGVFLIHPFVIDALFNAHFSFDKLHLNVYVFSVIYLVVVVVISLIISQIIDMIPKVRRIIGSL